MEPAKRIHDRTAAGGDTTVKLILSRHGQTVWNTHARTQGRTDIPLTELGRRQAERLAKRLAPQQLAAVYCSPLARALETAEILCRGRALSPACTPLLMERDFGNWEGEPFLSLKEKYPEQVAQWDLDPYAFTPPEAEPLPKVGERVSAFLQELRSAYQKEDAVVVVGHSIPLRLMIAELIGLPPRHLHNLRLDNASYTEIRMGTRHQILCVFNDCAHLEGLQ